MSERKKILPLVSTIIPVLNDAEALGRCLSALKNCARSDANEVIVADGGASSECRAISDKFNAAYVSSMPGRATQMNRATAVARGEWLWFVHADCVPDAASLDAMASLDANALWGCFRHRINSGRRGLRVIECADNLRAKMFGLPYGDQGIFVRAKTFLALGGYADVPLLEDVILARRLGEMCAPRVLRPVLTADARRWNQRGILPTTWLNWRIMIEYLSGRKTPRELAALYRGK